MPAPRFFVDQPLQPGAAFSLPAGAARHVQVLRLQPGAAITLFDGTGGEWAASVVQMGRSEVSVQLGVHAEVERELPLPVTLALGMPANERMDTVIEKATELGAVAIQPLLCERSVLRLSGERAQKKVSHWKAVALAASEQSGRTRVPQVAPVQSLGEWLRALPRDDRSRWMLSFDAAQPLASLVPSRAGVVSLSGPEGGLSPAEEALARAAGFAPVSLGARVLRADTAPLALLAHLAIGASG
ncbi:MAG TPA: 16S rRNA (uracil(1498)-N(3))-methyltransferase [Burkholderiaceae bacterium]|nr:16S rRNA (uracil(1498)-N(3))-methyltransferase [Burkholderiaceae bacterium]